MKTEKFGKHRLGKVRFKVVCAWCGSEIREDKHEDEQGICLECFYKMLGDHLQAQRQGRGEFASDR